MTGQKSNIVRGRLVKRRILYKEVLSITGALTTARARLNRFIEAAIGSPCIALCGLTGLVPLSMSSAANAILCSGEKSIPVE